MDGYVHLHVHSHYSLLDGGNRIKDLLQTARSFGMDSLALTDHGNLFGAMDFYKEAQAVGVRPILGMEAYISPTTRQDRSMGNIQTAAYHLLLLDGEPGEVYNISSGQARTIRSLVDQLLALAEVEIVVETDPERYRPADVPVIYGSADKLQAATGWQPEIPFEQTVTDVLEEWRAKKI